MNLKQGMLRQTAFKPTTDDHKDNTGMLINFNEDKFVLIRKYRLHMRYENLT
jgi:hypothetical protein